MIDICTVVFREELPVLQAQAQSIEKYCATLGTRNIYVVVNDDDSVVNEIDSAWWGTLANRVMVIPRSAFSTEFVDNGWLSQQVLKMLASAMSYNLWCMVLDAKTIFVKPLTLEHLLDERERPQVGMLDIYEVFEPSRQITNKVFNVDLKKQLGPGGVPFLFNTQMTRAMIAEVEKSTAMSFPVWFQAQGMLTEFMLYSGYIESRFGLDVLYNTNTNAMQVCNVCHSEVAAFERKFNEMQTSLTVSVHRNAWKELSDQQRQQYQYFLIDRGITEAWKL